MYEVTIIDEFNQRHLLSFQRHEYPSLMELIRDRLGSEIGDCRGRVWCNTCAVKCLNNKMPDLTINAEEVALISVLPLENVRLSCQLDLDANLNATTWEILDSRRFI